MFSAFGRKRSVLTVVIVPPNIAVEHSFDRFNFPGEELIGVDDDGLGANVREPSVFEELGHHRHGHRVAVDHLRLLFGNHVCKRRHVRVRPSIGVERKSPFHESFDPGADGRVGFDVERRAEELGVLVSSFESGPVPGEESGGVAPLSVFASCVEDQGFSC